MTEYQDLVNRVLSTGRIKSNRTGVDTLSVFNHNYSVDLRKGFPLLTTKKVLWKNIVLENLWFLSGQSNIHLLHKHNINFWDHWADSKNRVRSPYGRFWRYFPGKGNLIDQVKHVLKTLKNTPDSRRGVITAWYPDNALNSPLPPCHLLWVFNVQYTSTGQPLLNLHLTQRSADIALGVPYNLAGYSLLLTLFAHLLDMTPGFFGHSIVDAHIYTNHVEGLSEQMRRPVRALPTVEIDSSIQSLTDVEGLLVEDTDTILNTFKLTNYNPHPEIKFKVAV